MATTLYAATDYGEMAIAGYVASWTLWVGLMTTAGGETKNGGVEVSAGDYARKQVTFVVDPLNPDKVVNSGAALAFGTPATNWGDVVELRAFTLETGGDDMLYWTLATATACDAGAPVSVPLNGLSLTAK
jgi:hypothetical protein